MDRSENTLRFTEFDERTGIIDFEDEREGETKQQDAHKENKFFQRTFSDSDEIYPPSDDPSHNLQYPLLSMAEPPVGISRQNIREMWCKSVWYVKLRSRFLVSEFPPYQCGTIHGFLGLYNERTRHLTSFPYTIHPYSDFMTYWNFLLGIFLMTNFIYSPYLIAFEPLFFVESHILAVNLFVSSTLLIDIALNFLTGRRNKRNGIIELDPRIIIYQYFTGWFLFDLLSRAPVDGVLTFQLTNEEKMIKTNLEKIRIIALITRTLRYRKMFEILCRIAEICQIRSLVIPWVLKLVILVLYCFHWMACFHWLMPDVVNSRLPAPKQNSWVTSYDLWNKSCFEKYINSYLRSLSNLLTLDGGSFIPRETEEILCTIIGIFLSVSLFGYFISSFSAVMGEINGSMEKFEKMYEIIQDYLTIRKIPPILQNKVLQYYDRKYRGHMFSDAAIMTTLSPSLRMELSCHNCRTLMEKVPLFQKLPVGVIVQLAEQLEYDVYVPGDVLITAETQGEAMFFIQSGEVKILDVFGEKIRVLADGEFFGEMALITTERRRETVVALQPSEIYKLSKANWHDTVEVNSEVYNKIAEFAQKKLLEEKRVLDEESKRVHDKRNWKSQKKSLAERIKQTDAIVIDTTGIEFAGEEADDDDDVDDDDDDDDEVEEDEDEENPDSVEGEPIILVTQLKSAGEDDSSSRSETDSSESEA